MPAKCPFIRPSIPNLAFLDARSYKCSMPVWQAAAAGKDIVLALCRDFTDPWTLQPDAFWVCPTCFRCLNARNGVNLTDVIRHMGMD